MGDQEGPIDLVLAEGVAVRPTPAAGFSFAVGSLVIWSIRSREPVQPVRGTAFRIGSTNKGAAVGAAIQPPGSTAGWCDRVCGPLLVRLTARASKAPSSPLAPGCLLAAEPRVRPSGSAAKAEHDALYVG